MKHLLSKTTVRTALQHTLSIFFVFSLCMEFFLFTFENVASAKDLDQPNQHKEEQETLLHSGSNCEKQILQKLRNLQDPELKINIVDLGLVRMVECDEQNNINIVTIILTSPLCPYIKDLVSSIKAASKSLFPEKSTKVIVDTKTRWNPSHMSEQAKKGFWGVPE